jgi:hypothetical protein
MSAQYLQSPGRGFDAAGGVVLKLAVMVEITGASRAHSNADGDDSELR